MRLQTREVNGCVGQKSQSSFTLDDATQHTSLRVNTLSLFNVCLITAAPHGMLRRFRCDRCNTT